MCKSAHWHLKAQLIPESREQWREPSKVEQDQTMGAGKLSGGSGVNLGLIRNHQTAIRKSSNHLSVPVVQVKTRVAVQYTQCSAACLCDFALKAYPESDTGNSTCACKWKDTEEN